MLPPSQKTGGAGMRGQGVAWGMGGFFVVDETNVGSGCEAAPVATLQHNLTGHWTLCGQPVPPPPPPLPLLL